MNRTKKIVHVYFGDHHRHPIISNYKRHFQNRLNLEFIDVKKSLGGRIKRIINLSLQIMQFRCRHNDVLHTHDLVSFYLCRFLYPFNKIIYDSHEIYSSYFNNPVALLVRVLEELATLISFRRIMPSKERTGLYYFSKNTVIIENLFLPTECHDREVPKPISRGKFIYAGLLEKQRCLEEVINFFRTRSEIELDIFGGLTATMSKHIDEGLPVNVKYRGEIAQKDLVLKLPEYTAAFALYQPCNLNNLHPAPTKIFENEYMGLSTIAFKSDYLERLINEGRLINTFLIEELADNEFRKFLIAKRNGNIRPNTSRKILWDSQGESFSEIYQF